MRKPLRFLTIPAVWVVIEFLKEIIWCGFGWANLGYSQFEKLYLVQIADLGGTKLISFIIVLVNFLIWEIVIAYRGKEKKAASRIVFKRILSLLLIFSATVTYSFFRLNQEIETDKKVNISVIQPNILSRQFLSSEERKEALDDLAVLVGKTSEDSLIVFSEAAWPYTLADENIDKLYDFVRKGNRDILIGAINQRNRNYYNSAFLFDRSGKLNKIYDKIILVPFGEYVPLRRYLTFIEVLNQMGDITPGQTLAEFSHQGKKFAVLICFEDIVPLFTAHAAAGKDFLVNITDDSWFGGEPQATQHLSIMVLRAVENRIPIVRAANTGFSGWVSAQGRVNKLRKGSESLFVQAKKDFEITTRRKRSFYNRRREGLVFLSFVFLAAMAFVKVK